MNFSFALNLFGREIVSVGVCWGDGLTEYLYGDDDDDDDEAFGGLFPLRINLN